MGKGRRIRVLLSLILAQSKFKERSLTVLLPEGSRISEVCERFQIPKDEPIAVIRNGRIANRDDRLNENDRLVILTLLEGG